MNYTIFQLRVRNFKCFDSKKFYQFTFQKDRNPTILSGPNGFGKTTFFDAVELIFTKKITRLQTSIEDGRINLGKNILLNESNKDGNLVLTLMDENDNFLTIVAVIDNQIQKLFIEESIKYSVIDGTLESDQDIEAFLDSQPPWKSSLNQFNKLKYSMERFNVYYYVSQAESVHFLKNSITSRKDSMNALLNTEKIDGYIEYISKEIIGNNKSKKGVIINDAISTSEDSLKSYISLLKPKLQGVNLALQEIEYFQLLEYPADVAQANWDKKIIDFSDTESEFDLHSALFEIRSLHNFSANSQDYNIYLQNQKINALISDSVAINDFIYFNQYINNTIIDKEKIGKAISQWNQLIDIYNHSAFFRKELEISNYKKEDLIKLQEIKSDLISADIEEVSEIVNSINDTNKMLSNRQSMLNDLEKARIKLHQVKSDFEKESSNCPFCNYKYGNVEELEQAFINLTNSLSGEKSDQSQNVQILIKSLNTMLKKDSDSLLAILKEYDDQKIHELNDLILRIKQFVGNEKRIKSVEAMNAYLSTTSSWIQLGNNEKPLEIQRILQGDIKNYSNPNFDSDADKFKFNEIRAKYKSVLSISQTRIANKEYVEKKMQYIQHLNSLSINKEIVDLKNEIKKEISKLHKLKSIRSTLEELQRLYRASIDEYKNQILKKLRVPLLGYV